MTKRFHTYKPSNLDHKYAFTLEEDRGMVHMHLVDARTGEREASILTICSDGTLGLYSNYTPKLRGALEQAGLWIDSDGRIKLSDARPVPETTEDTQDVFPCIYDQVDTLTVETRPRGGVCVLFDVSSDGERQTGSVYLDTSKAANLYRHIGRLLTEQGVDL